MTSVNACLGDEKMRRASASVSLKSCSLCNVGELRPSTECFSIDHKGKFFGIEQTPGFVGSACGCVKFDENITKRLIAKAKVVMAKRPGRVYICQYEEMQKEDPFEYDDDDLGL